MPVHKVKGGYKWGNHGHVYPTRAGAERQARAAFAHGYRGDAKARMAAAKVRHYGLARTDSAEQPRMLPVYPPEHQVGMEVTKGGSCCANCEYYCGEGICGSWGFEKWNVGSNVIPLPDGDPERYCCDLWSPSDD